MKRPFLFIIIILISFVSSTFGQGKRLKVGIETFNPPFVIQSSNKSVYGFDVDMMNSLCKIINRTCEFHLMPFEKLLDAVAAKKIDVAVSSITITFYRSKLVHFSLPYLPSYSRFLARKSSPINNFSVDKLNNKKIGLGIRTIFQDQIDSMGVKDPIIKYYNSINSQLHALVNGDIDVILLDNEAAIYWASNSSNEFKLEGPPYLYGHGYGIAISPYEPNLLNEINNALIQYENSAEYQQNYDKYLNDF